VPSSVPSPVRPFEPTLRTDRKAGVVRASRQASQQVGDDNPPGWHRAYRALRQAPGAHSPAAGLGITVACCLILLVLLAPNDLGRLTPSTFVRIPLEAVLGFALLLMLPEKVRWVGALLLGVGLGLMAILKLIDMGF
jgi:hypothetical protein